MRPVTQVTPDVNLYPCDGHLIQAQVSLRLITAVTSASGDGQLHVQGSHLLDPRASLTTAAASMSPVAEYLFEFKAPQLRGAEVHWINVSEFAMITP